MPGLIVTLGGSSTPYEQMLARSVTQAKAAGVAIQREYERTQAIIGRRISPIQSMEAMNPASTLINKQAITSAEQDYVAFWETTLAAKAAADAEQVAMNQAKLETIVAQEKAAGVEYESDRAAQLAAAIGHPTLSGGAKSRIMDFMVAPLRSTEATRCSKSTGIAWRLSNAANASRYCASL